MGIYMHSVSVLKSRQIKAARALVDWSQEDLANAANLSIATIRKLELGNISPRDSTNMFVRSAFEDAGLEFLDPDGVRHRTEDIAVYQGEDGTKEFFDDIYQEACKDNKEIIQVWDSAQSIFEVLGEYRQVHFDRMAALGSSVTVKCILTEDFDFTPASYCKYRLLSKHYVNSVPFYVYGDKYAIILFKTDPGPRIIVIHSRVASDAFRQQFNSMWDKATPLSKDSRTGALLNKKKL